MRSETEYHLPLRSAPAPGTAETVFDLVWRFDFTAPGFCLLDLYSSQDSQTLRSWMVKLKEHLSAINVRRGDRPFAFRSMGRFDQQETTKFHLDGAPEQSMLMLGYEPSNVHSRLFLADYTHAAYDQNITPQRFLQDFNPMYRRGEELLDRYVTELPQPSAGHSRILLVNNSVLPFTEERKSPLGVMHKAEIVNPSECERRIVNSVMLATEGEEVDSEKQLESLTTNKISQKLY